MWPALKPSQRVAVVGAIDPQSSSTTITTSWIDASQFHKFMAVIQAGALGASATVDAKFQQAQDNTGTGVKDVTGAAIAQLTKAGTDKSSTQSELNLRAADLDSTNGFTFVRLSVTCGVAASLVSATVLGFDPHYAPADAYAASTVTQIVN